MEICRVELKVASDNSYDIVIGCGLSEKLAEELQKTQIANAYTIITDSNVERIYGKKLLQDLKSKGIHSHLISFPAGEKSKSRKIKEKIEDSMLKLALGRDTCIIALGGGVVGDVAGFAAATYMRGIPYIQVPTTLLAMVDSSIGGKVAVDTRHAKNSIGAFHQPKKVIADLNFLKTLPKKELANGLAEMIKHALVKDKNFFSFLEKNIGKILNRDFGALETAVKMSCRIKSLVVMQDEKERGMRKILNYGHTIGHAVESALNYKISHGNAIAIGMYYAAKISAKLGFLDEESAIRQNNLLEHAGLPHKLSHSKLNFKKIIEHMRYDKKIIGSWLNFVLLNSIGGAFVSDKVTFEDIRDILEE